MNPDNYRGITLLSYFGKLFTSIINDRITKFVEDENILSHAQAGFRKGYSTTEQIFNLKCLIESVLTLLTPSYFGPALYTKGGWVI